MVTNCGFFANVLRRAVVLVASRNVSQAHAGERWRSGNAVMDVMDVGNVPLNKNRYFLKKKQKKHYFGRFLRLDPNGRFAKKAHCARRYCAFQLLKTVEKLVSFDV